MTEMNEDIQREYEKIKDKISYEDFLKEMRKRMQDYEEVTFMGELDVARVIVGEYIDEVNQPLSKDNPTLKISELKTGNHNISLIGRVMRISNVKKFTSRKGKEGKLANLLIADETGEIRGVMWTENIKLLKKINEGDIIKISNLEIKQGLQDDEAHLNINSTIEVLEEDFPEFPSYEEKISNISDIKEGEELNVMARIIRIPRIRTFDRNGREGKVASLEIQDQTGKIIFTLWNKDADLIENLHLEEGDSIKILGAHSRARNGEISLSHSWLGRIIKGEYDVPEFEESIIKIGDAHEMRDITIIGVISKIYDAITFVRDDGSTGKVRSLEIEDDTGKIRVTLWNEDTKIELKKGDIIKITGGNIEFDQYSGTDYRINTNWNTKIVINPPLNQQMKEILQECGKYLKPLKIEDLNSIEDDGEEIDVIGRVINLFEPNQFQRDDGSVGIVRSAEISDGTGLVRISFWDDKAEIGLNLGDAIKIENARTRMGTYKVELSVGKTARLLKPCADDLELLPSLKEMEKSIYKNKNIEELQEGDRDIRIIGRIVALYDPHKFTRSDGSTGLVRTAEIGDHTGVIRASLWDEKANTPLNEGDVIKIENPRVNYRNNRVEISLNRTTPLKKIKNEEAQNIPSLDEIQEKRYPKKKIDEIEEEDRNIKVKGNIIEAYGNKILYEMCPSCNKRITLGEDGYICEICGEEIEEPTYLMIIPVVLEDETGTMRTTFFRKAAEELLGMTTPEVEEIIKKTGDEGSLEDKVADLVEKEITIIANASFDEYNEEIRLNALKVIEIKL